MNRRDIIPKNQILPGRHFKVRSRSVKTLDDYVNEFEELWQDAEAIWDRQQYERDFESYAGADYRELLPWLMRLRDQTTSILEWGSGLGVVTIMASHLGFDAYGIEVEPVLLDFSQELAERFEAKCQFALGSFIPDAFVWRPSAGEEAIRTSIDDADGYDALGMELHDFELVYGYPWPTEHELYQNILRQFGSPNVQLLTYDAREGVSVMRFN